MANPNELREAPAETAVPAVTDAARRLKRQPLWRAFSPVISLGLAGLGAVLVLGWHLPTIGAALGSVLAASVTVYAAFVSYRLKQEDDARLEAERRIMERLGVAAALTAEIEDNKDESERVYEAFSIVDIWRRLHADPAFMPFLVEDKGASQVYDALIDRLMRLPDTVVRPVVRYYAAHTTLNESIAAWRSADFRAPCDPASPRSVESGRPRQIRFIIWTLLSLSDIFAVPVGDPADIEAGGDTELATMVRDHFAGRVPPGAPEDGHDAAWRPLADAAVRALRHFADDCRSALAFLEWQMNA